MHVQMYLDDNIKEMVVEAECFTETEPTVQVVTVFGLNRPTQEGWAMYSTAGVAVSYMDHAKRYNYPAEVAYTH